MCVCVCVVSGWYDSHCHHISLIYAQESAISHPPSWLNIYKYIHTYVDHFSIIHTHTNTTSKRIMYYVIECFMILQKKMKQIKLWKTIYTYDLRFVENWLYVPVGGMVYNLVFIHVIYKSPLEQPLYPKVSSIFSFPGEGTNLHLYEQCNF